ncbi:sugar transferase [Hymenobacter canadensis]|uniref:Sugar transferase n=1 Tax=Hymenobacter canadensis TaxID=2999067 RepID=A0ABY7LRM0_9BACT|nr:sugar transferase [Hymenobacter canadensis]WBA43071.1 sugar transferase [Hymenobacter canadensis]
MQVRKTVVYVSADPREAARFQQQFADDLAVLPIGNATELLELCEQRLGSFEAILNAAPLNSPLGLGLIRTLKKDRQLQCPVFVLADQPVSTQARSLLLEAGVADILPLRLPRTELLTHLYLLARPAGEVVATPFAFRMSPTKRLLDVVLAGAALLCLSPLLLLVAGLIKLESRGPVLYYSHRVGTGYKVFRFWKFRSMRPDADKLLASMKNLNQYAAKAPEPGDGAVLTAATVVQLGLCESCAASGSQCQQLLIDGQGELICEKLYRDRKKAEDGAAFVKIANDPRITRIGHFIRNTSIDELPQLWNVLCGDMSIVGNRPLPLYEAEKMMTDHSAARFIAPAGLTGLWQVSKRGKGGDMSEQERIALDVEYARRYSLWEDMRIILRTIPALFQKENV